MGFEPKIVPGGSSPIFRQIVDQVRLAVSTGQLLKGAQLPSVRALAEQLLINPNTVAKAYSELISDGVIESQPGKGAFIAEPREIYTKSEKLRRIEPHVEALVTEGISIGLSTNQIIEAVQARLKNLQAGNK